jgi:hypothetical protein
MLLGLFLSIAYEGDPSKNTSEQRRVSTLNDKWQKITLINGYFIFSLFFSGADQYAVGSQGTFRRQSS